MLFGVSGFYPSFSVVDTVTGSSAQYTGNYTLQIIAGSLDGVHFENFTEQQRFDYNNQNRQVKTYYNIISDHGSKAL